MNAVTLTPSCGVLVLGMGQEPHSYWDSIFRLIMISQNDPFLHELYEINCIHLNLSTSVLHT